MAVARTDAIIAGVNKAGTTSLFVSLSTHPDVAPSSIKETRYFLPPRYGEPLPPAVGVGRATSPTPATGRCTSRRHRRTSTAARRVAEAMRDRLVDPHALVVLRGAGEPRPLVLHLPEDPVALPRRLPDHRLPRRGRPPHGPPTSTIPTTRSTWRSAVAATPTSCPGGSTCSAPNVLHVVDFDRLVGDQVDHAARHRVVARPRSRTLPRRRAQLREPHHRVQEQGVPARRARRQRQARAGAAASPRGQAQAARASTTG